MIWFVASWDPWFNRGGGMNIGGESGVFAFYHYYGHVNSAFSFRDCYYD